MALFDDSTTRRAHKEHQADTDFSEARLQAFWDEIRGFMSKKSTRLLPFDEVKNKLEICFAKELGMQTIPIDDIVGSQGRYRSFTKRFLPLDDDLRDRWKKVNQAHYSRRDLPPVELYKVGSIYFVKDGHHRVSVARTRGVRHIEAIVHEYECDVPLDKETDLEKLAIQETYLQFLKDTELRKNRPNPRLQLTLLGGYPILMEHIQAHKHYLEEATGREVTLSEAACSWYDTVYTPLAVAIRKNRIMKEFPHRTETDFYIWVIKNRRKLSEQYRRELDDESVVEAFSQKYTRPFWRIIGVFRRILGRVRYR
jgi:hypothetical protein